MNQDHRNEPARTPSVNRSPVIIIGAARSGTNMLRDVLTTLPGFTTWPCDEIPYVWRYGNRAWPDDEFPRSLARPAVQHYIRGAFAQRQGTREAVVVEKTCANSLRVGFVDEVMPDARFLVITRHGLDAAASAMKRWSAGFDLRYSLAKLRFVPLGDIPYYVIRQFGNRCRRLLSSERRLAVWGPVFSGMQEMAARSSLAELATQQWVRCVQRADAELAALASDRVWRLRYEEFVADPAGELAEILAFLDVPVEPERIAAAVQHVRADSVGKASRSLSGADLQRMQAIAAPTLEQLGYRILPGEA